MDRYSNRAVVMTGRFREDLPLDVILRIWRFVSMEKLRLEIAKLYNQMVSQYKDLKDESEDFNRRGIQVPAFYAARLTSFRTYLNAMYKNPAGFPAPVTYRRTLKYSGALRLNQLVQRFIDKLKLRRLRRHLA